MWRITKLPLIRAVTVTVGMCRFKSSQSSMHKKALKALGNKSLDSLKQQQQSEQQQQTPFHEPWHSVSTSPLFLPDSQSHSHPHSHPHSPVTIDFNGNANSHGGMHSNPVDPEKLTTIASPSQSETYNETIQQETISKKTSPHRSSAMGQLHEFAPRIIVAGVGGGGSNALNHMIAKGLQGVDFLALNTDAQHLSTTLTDQRLQLGVQLTQGLGCGANPDAGRLAAEECRDGIVDALQNAHMLFITAGMGGGTGTGAAPVVAEIAFQMGILTVAVVTLPFSFEGTHRRRLALEGVHRLQNVVDTLIVIPNQNLFALATPETSFVEAFSMTDDVLLGGVKSITDLMTSPGLINLDFADVQSVMHGMGNALLGTGVASGSERALEAAQMALDNPLLGSDLDISTAKGMLVNITGGPDMTLFEVDKAAQYVTQRVLDNSANIIFGSAYDASLQGSIRVSVVATGIDEVGHVLP